MKVDMGSLTIILTGTRGGAGIICGVDEAGKGAVFGPLVVAAVCCSEPFECAHLGVRDSKLLTPSQREGLFYEIRARYRTVVVSIDASSIDAFLKKNTMNECVIRAHAVVLRQLRPSVAYVDACDVNAARYGESLRTLLDCDSTIIAEHKADRTYPVVSAASVVAKVMRDRTMAELRQNFGALGSGYPADPVTRRFLHRYIAEWDHPPPFARASWKTVEKCLASRSQANFSDYE